MDGIQNFSQFIMSYVVPAYISLETKSCRISFRKLMIKYDRTYFPT